MATPVPTSAALIETSTLNIPEMPIPSASSESWASLRSLIQTLERANIALGKIKDSLQEFLRLTAIYERFKSTWDEYEAIKQELEASFEQLAKNCAGSTRLRITKCVEGLCRDIRVELAHIRHYSLVQQSEHWSRASDSGELLQRYRRIQALFHSLLLNTDPSTWDNLQKDASSTVPFASQDYNSIQPTGQTLHTNPAEIRRLHDWMKASPPGAICWIPDATQTGISRALCAELDATRKLGASFFFSQENNDSNLIIPSVANQLANYSIPFRLALSDRGQQASSNPLDVQFEELITVPLARVRGALPADFAVVIDATNECGSVRRILDTILAKSNDSPIKFFVFSRPEPYEDTNDRLFVHRIGGECFIEGVEGELRTALGTCGLPEVQIAEFVQRAGILFAYAASAVHYGGGDTSWLKSSTLSGS